MFVQVGVTPLLAAPSGTQKTKLAMSAREAEPAWSCWRVCDGRSCPMFTHRIENTVFNMLSLTEHLLFVSSGKVLPGVDALSNA